MRKLTTQEQATLGDFLAKWHEAPAGPEAGNIADELSDWIESLLPAPRTDQEIIDQTEQLARTFGEMAGYSLFEPFQSSNNPRAADAWRKACVAQELLTGTDVENAIANLEPPAPPLEISLKWKVYALKEHLLRFNGTGHDLFDALADKPEDAEHTFKAFQCTVHQSHSLKLRKNLARDIVDMAEKLQRLENEK